MNTAAASALDRIAAQQFADPASDDLTVPLAIENAEKDALIARLRLEAQAHASEARTANATIAEIYKIVTGARGEPGNWNGAKPVADEIARLRGGLQTVVTDLLSICDGSNWPENAQSGPGYEAYSEITEQLHEIAANLQDFLSPRTEG